MEKKIRYGIAKFLEDEVPDNSTVWYEDTFPDALAHVREDGQGQNCGFFLYSDIKEELGFTTIESIMFASREQFEANPIRFGICYYKDASGKWIFE